MKIKLSDLHLNTGQIKDVPKNPRFIKDDKYELLKKSIVEDPKFLEYNRPLVYDNDGEFVVVGGNMRIRALKDLGWKEVDCDVMEKDLDPKVLRSRIIKHNNGYGEDDADLLANEWDAFELEEWGLDLPAFDDKEIEEDEAPEVSQEEPKSKFGEIYQLGKHRVMCGDALNNIDVLMGENKADLLLTDPPYGVSYADKNEFLNSISPGNRNQTKIANDHQTPEQMKEFWTDVFGGIFPYLKDDSSYYICSPQGGELLLLLLLSLFEIGYPSRHMIIWSKNNHVLGRCDYNYKHEPLLFGWKEKHQFYGKGKQHTSVWEIDKPRQSKEHPTMKPIELMAECLLNSSKENEIVLDAFLGSGTTLIACEQTGRICYGMELDPKYVDVIRRRYWKFINNGDEDGWEDGTKAI